ncbi:hypothetical protein BpHYR1_033487 [Brachionus plicatilis]|uniref:CCHC-type domain-containing protein n=1 Tax=Brachionus plicatilis TaxID=10195 RepID=A0A3M7QX54_BRAPC|nr:hypothetical protein BpHYR1_033487 [Brachionus plicatilis]
MDNPFPRLPTNMANTNPWNHVSNMFYPNTLAYFNLMKQHQHQFQPNQNTTRVYQAPQIQQITHQPSQPLQINQCQQNIQDPNMNQSRKCTRGFSQALATMQNQDETSTTVPVSEPVQKQNYNIKFSSKKQFPQHQRSYLNLDKEPKRCLPGFIANANINQKNDLPNDSFTNGIELVKKKEQKFYVALNVSLDFNISDQENLTELKDKFNIDKALRVVKKSSTYVKVRPWRFYIQADQCFHCQKIGHTKQACPSIDKPPTCVRCKGTHSHDKCQITDSVLFRCVNCPEYLLFCSKQCKAITNDINRKKTELEMRAKKTEHPTLPESIQKTTQYTTLNPIINQIRQPKQT